MEEVTDVFRSEDALNVVRIEIRNRLGQRQALWEKVIALDGEISGLRAAEHQLEKLPGHAVVLSKPAL